MPDSFLKVVQEISNKTSSHENIKSVPCKVVELLDDEKVRIKVVSTGAIYTVLNRCGNDVHIGENVSLYYHGDVIIGNQAYIGAALNKASDKYYTKPETDDMLNGMSIQKISKSDFDALLVKNPNRVYFVYDNQGEYDIYIGDSKIDGEGGGSDYLPIYIKAKINNLIGETTNTTYKAGDISDICDFVSTTSSAPNGNCELSLKPRNECLLVACVTFPGKDNEQEGEVALCQNMLESLGFEKITGIILGNPFSSVGGDRWRCEVWTKYSNGSTVYLWGNNSAPYHRFYNIAFMALYGAKSVEVVYAGTPSRDITFEFPAVEGETQNTWVGFTTPPPDGKPRIYYYGESYTGGQHYITDADTLDYEAPRPQPSSYVPTIAWRDDFTSLGMGGNPFFDIQQNSGLIWWYDSKTGSTQDWNPAYTHARGIIVLDVNYD